MGKLILKYRERETAIGKIKGDTTNGLVVGTGPERKSWYYVGGKKTFKVRVGQVHQGDMTPGALNALRNELKLSQDQLSELVRCRMSGVDYHNHVLVLQSQEVV